MASSVSGELKFASPKQSHRALSRESSKSVKILVLGDTGAGKSAFIHLFANKVPTKHTTWTIGCNIEVLPYESGGKDFFVELWDIGGSEKFAQARPVFFKDAHGLILVHDLSNKKSHANLKKWLHQVIKELGGSNEYVWSDELQVSTVSASSSLSLPVLVVGTRLDLTNEYKNAAAGDENGLDGLNISCMDPDTFKTGSHASQKLSSFINRCIQGLIARDAVLDPDRLQRRTERRQSPASPSVRATTSGIQAGTVSSSRFASGRLDDDDQDVGYSGDGGSRLSMRPP